MNPWDQERARGTVAALRGAAHHLRVVLRDARANLRWLGTGPRILVLRQRRNNWNYNDHFLAWVAARVPEARALFALRRVPSAAALDLGRVALLLPWLQDPLRERFPEAYRAARGVEDACRARGIPVVNPVDALSNTVKSVAAAALARAGVPVPAMQPIDDPAAFRRTRGGMTPPFIVREDRMHGGATFLVERDDELARVPIEALACPLAVRFVDVRGADGLYRKWRYLTAGDWGLPRHLRHATRWNVSRNDIVSTDATRAEEAAYLGRPEPNHALFQRARRALGLDVVAFDYAYDRDGRLVVFEPNPLPLHWVAYDDERGSMHARAIDVVYATLLAYYLARAGLPVAAWGPPLAAGGADAPGPRAALLADGGGERARRDSNSRPADPKSAALSS